VANEALRKQNQHFRDQAGMNMSLYDPLYVQQTQSATHIDTLINQAREEIEMDKKAFNEAESKGMIIIRVILLPEFYATF
jgi:hypothetical protein